MIYFFFKICICYFDVFIGRSWYRFGPPVDNREDTLEVFKFSSTWKKIELYS